ncbi:HEAT repeat domain-containing protein [Kitasatospora sp. NE20-6]|uniref:HEAT repeat domain-containing protein n=1 Tax=Kitasatospora sp. NE20-6 TaxID=2859066 RepID=UPI0038B3AC5A
MEYEQTDTARSTARPVPPRPRPAEASAPAGPLREPPQEPLREPQPGPPATTPLPRRPDGTVHLDAAPALADGVPALVDVFLRSADDRRLHHSATRALLAAGPPAVEALAAHVPWDRGTALRIRQSLAWFHGRADCESAYAVAVLTELLSDPDSRTRAEAARSLGLVGDPVAAPVLLRALAHPDRDVRARAAHALGRCGARAARERLEELTRDDCDPEVRRAAALALRLLAQEPPGRRSS